MHPDITSADDLLGWDAEWVASDADGHIGLFTTAGDGYMPESAWRDVDALTAAVAAILGMSVSTTARFAPEVRPGSENIWRDAAERGLFGFDSDGDGAGYNRVASPMTPVHVSAMPAAAAGVLRRVHCPHVNFAASETISASSLR